MKPSSVYTIVAFVALLALSGCSSAPKAVGSYAPEDVEAKNLTPAQGKALVYFFYGRSYGWGNIEIALDGASSPINGQMYVVWDVPAGRHVLSAIVPGQNELFRKIAKTSLDTPAGSVHYYRLIAYKKEESDPVSETLYRLAPADNSEGKEFVQAYSLISWFRDGERIYYNDALPNIVRPQQKLP